MVVALKLACSKRSDSGERCEVKKGMKSRGGLLFFRAPFTSHRSSLSERLEQATLKLNTTQCFRTVAEWQRITNIRQDN